jgi:pyrroloquinoline-quinone synthase
MSIIATSAPDALLEARIRAVLDEKSLLKHPFYVEWTEGTLPLEKLREYARQYYHFEAAFPRFLSAIHARTESLEVRQLLLDNLWDEEHGDRNHIALWLEFGAALGLDPEEIRAGSPNAETRALVDHFHAAAKERPIGEAMATLFAYEGQVPRVAWQKMKGLTDHYGMEPGQFEFFSVHLVADVSHSGAEIAAIHASTIDEDAVLQATSDACDRLLTFLDGCYAEPAAA